MVVFNCPCVGLPGVAGQRGIVVVDIGASGAVGGDDPVGVEAVIGAGVVVGSAGCVAGQEIADELARYAFQCAARIGCDVVIDLVVGCVRGGISGDDNGGAGGGCAVSAGAEGADCWAVGELVCSRAEARARRILCFCLARGCRGCGGGGWCCGGRGGGAIGQSQGDQVRFA